MIFIDTKMPESCRACHLLMKNESGYFCGWHKKPIPQSQLDKRSPLCEFNEEEPTAQWLEEEGSQGLRKIYFCSYCGKDSYGQYEKTAYCPDCGHKMVESTTPTLG